jgi:fumarylacetoacetate (FAA) hydrolase
MKLASLKSRAPDARLVVVSRDLANAAAVPEIAASLQAAMDDWARCAPRLAAVYHSLTAGERPDAFPFMPREAASPLPRAYQWCDGSVYLPHMERMSRWRGLPVPEVFFREPFVYQGGSDGFLGPTDPIPLVDEAWGLDFEAELAIVTDEVPLGTSATIAAPHIKLVMLCNDVSLRNLIPPELDKGFGFYQSKPASAFSPVAVTPDELGSAWKDAKLSLPIVTTFNGTEFGRPNCAVGAQFSFADIIAHAAKTRALAAGSIIGSGTVANPDISLGTSCIAEKRVLETLGSGKPITPYMRHGDRVRIEMFDAAGKSIFGAIDQTVAQYARS